MKDVDTCFWCLKPRNEMETFEKGVDRMIFHGYTPCKRCKEMFDRGIHVIGVTKTASAEGMIPISKSNEGEDLYPTGSMFVGTEQWVTSFLSEENDKPLLDEVLKTKVMLMPDEIVNKVVQELQEQNPDLPDLVEDEELKAEQNNGEVVVESTVDKLKGE